jgi:DNA (cytosine-5)-methyltransferase 1
MPERQMKKYKLLDLFCGAGGCSMGYHRAGFEVVGVDINPQPHYPFEFYQADAETYLDHHYNSFDVIHASPPCQRFSAMRKGRWQDREHPDKLTPIRESLMLTGKSYIIENVIGAPMINPILLCGTMFGLETETGNQLRRHRLFECSFPVLSLCCNHNSASAIGVYGGGQHPLRRKRQREIDKANSIITDFGIKARRKAMGIDWMSGKELNQAIPPQYTEYIGNQLQEILRANLNLPTPGMGAQ